MDNVSKICSACQCLKPLSEYYKRSYSNSVTSECKECMKKRSVGKWHKNEDYMKSLVMSEELAIAFLHRNGIPALPGKALRQSHVDVIAFGCVHIEVKYAPFEVDRTVKKFTFKVTPSQQKNGFRAEVVILICGYDDHMTYHLFDAKDPVFYMHGRVKTGFTFTPGSFEAKKHGNNRVVMTQPMMNAAEDKVSLVFDKLNQHVEAIKKGA